MTANESTPRTFEHDDPGTIVNFIDPDGDTIARWSATTLPIPSVGDTVSFGELRAPSADSLDGDDATYQLGDTLYDVIEVEYNYSEVRTEADETPPFSGLVVVSVYLSPANPEPDTTS